MVGDSRALFPAIPMWLWEVIKTFHASAPTWANEDVMFSSWMWRLMTLFEPGCSCGGSWMAWWILCCVKWCMHTKHRNISGRTKSLAAVCSLSPHIIKHTHTCTATENLYKLVRPVCENLLIYSFGLFSPQIPCNWIRPALIFFFPIDRRGD